MRRARRSVRRWLTKQWLPISALGGLIAFTAIAYIALSLAPDWFAETEGLTAKDRASARQGVRTATLALLAGGLAVIEQLGHCTIDVRLGGIYALERVAKDSNTTTPKLLKCSPRTSGNTPPVNLPPLRTPHRRTHPRPHPPKPSQSTSTAHPDTDVQAALTVLGRRNARARKGHSASNQPQRGGPQRGGPPRRDPPRGNPQALRTVWW
jgi:hypothetical protein